MEHEERLKAALGDRYQIEREIGSGGMATVYLAQDSKHNRKVAVRVLDPDLAQTLGAERFLREIETAANLTHPHILPVFDSGEADGFLYYVMPYVKGESLRARLVREKQLPVEDAVQITREIADAMAYAHREGVIHRDVKPANIMLEEGHAVLADFGVAHAIAEAKDERITRTGTSLGTPAYMSPEQATGERDLDGRSDQYALGCVLYEMLAGQAPFTGATAESLIRQHLTSDPPDVARIRPTVPNDVNEALARALAKAPADRFATAGEFRSALSAQIQTPSGGVAPVSRPRSRRGLMLGVVGLAFVALAALLLWQPWKAAVESVAVGSPPGSAILADAEGTAPPYVLDLVGGLLAGDIDASGVVTRLTEGDIQRGLARAEKPDTTRLTESVARELAERGGINTVILPELDLVGSTYALTLRVLAAENDSILATERVEATHDDALISASREVVEKVMPSVAVWVGGGVREPRTNPPITPSLAAFRKRIECGRANSAQQYLEAASLCQEAVHIDPDFADAWAQMGIAYFNAGLRDSAAYAWEEALKHPERLTELRRSEVESWLSGDWLLRFQAQEREYRKTGVPTNNYAASLGNLGRYEDVVGIFQQIADRSVFGLSPIVAHNWAIHLLALDRVEEARSAVEALAGSPGELPFQALIALRGREWREAEGLATELVRDPTTTSVQGIQILAAALAAQGRVGEAVAALREGIDLSQKEGRGRAHVLSHAGLWILTTAAGLDPEPWHMEGLQADTTVWARVVSGLWAAQSADTALAESYMNSLPALASGEFGSLSEEEALVATLHARIAGSRGDWNEAARLLEPITRYRLWFPNGLLGIPNWLLSEAEEKRGRLSQAAEFYVASGGIGSAIHIDEVSYFGLTYSFAHRKAALLYGRLGEHAKAVEHWQAFLDAFTDPDPGFAKMVEEARAELARLEG